ncbi:MAG: hypothetical protein PUB47_01565 [Bacteroides sp.]|nr:hypothetical protein [Bacteroides sp.]
MGEFFGLVSAFFGWAFSGIGAVFAYAAAVPLFLLLIPVIVFGLFVVSVSELIPPKAIRSINRLKPGSELREKLESIYCDEIAEWNKEKVFSKIFYTIFWFVALVVLVFGLYVSNS